MKLLQALRLEGMMAFLYLRLKRKDSFISVIAGFAFLGMALSVATLIVVISVMNGFKEQLLNRILGVNGHISVFYKNLPSERGALQNEAVSGGDALGVNDQKVVAKSPLLWQQHQGFLGEVRGVRHVFPLVQRQVMVLYEGKARGALVHGMSVESLANRPFLKQGLIKGSLGDFKGRVVFVGHSLAKRLGLVRGDFLTLASPQPLETALGSLPQFRRFRVAGLFNFGLHDYDQTLLFMPLDEAQDFFRLRQAITGFEVFVDNPAAMEPVLGAYQKIALKDDLHIVDWQEANQTFFSVIQVERNVMAAILLLMIMVAAFNVISGLVMLVKDKSSDIAVLRAMGASRAMVGRIFLWVGLMIGGFGSSLGVLLGLFVAHNLEHVRGFLEYFTGAKIFPAEFYFLSQLPSRVDSLDVLWITLASVVLALLASIYPALRAARLPPHRALRFE